MLLTFTNFLDKPKLSNLCYTYKGNKKLLLLKTTRI